MTKGTKIALITIGALVLGVGIYMLVTRNKYKSGNKEKDNRVVNFNRN